MKLTDSQFGALCSLRDHGPVMAVEVRQPPAMDGTRKIKLECHLMNIATLTKLEALGLVTVERGEMFRPIDAVGKAGRARRELRISISPAGEQELGNEARAS